MEIEPLALSYKVHRIQCGTPDFAFLTGRYAALFLHALSADPKSFGVAYSTEASLSPAELAARLSREHANVFVCVAHPSQLEPHEQSVARGAWVGMVTQVGPTPKTAFWLRDSGTDEPLEDDLETKWHQTATWVDSAYRGKGIATLLIEAAVSYAKTYSADAVKQVRVRAFTGPDNHASQNLYGRCGFLIVGKCTIAEAMEANGNTAYPFHGRTDWSEELMHSRLGLVMEHIGQQDVKTV